MSRIVVTGADGFIGRPLIEILDQAGHEVVPLTRKQVVLGDSQMSSSKLESIIRGSQAVIHLAARAHVMSEQHADPLAEFRRTNVDGTLAIAEASARVGVERFIFMSSIGVLGNASGVPLTEHDPASPDGPYAISKWEAEQRLRLLAQKSGLAVVVVRPPLVYGPNVKGNFQRLLRLVQSGLPLPLAAVHNSRSYVGLDNLCEFLLSCVVHPSARGLTFHVSDTEDISTPELLETIAAAMGKKSRIFRCSPDLLRAASAFLGRQQDLERLIGNLRVDSSLAQATLGWRPTTPMHAGIGEMVRSFLHASHLNP